MPKPVTHGTKDKNKLRNGQSRTKTDFPGKDMGVSATKSNKAPDHVVGNSKK